MLGNVWGQLFGYNFRAARSLARHIPGNSFLLDDAAGGVLRAGTARTGGARHSKKRDANVRIDRQPRHSVGPPSVPLMSNAISDDDHSRPDNKSVGKVSIPEDPASPIAHILEGGPSLVLPDGAVDPIYEAKARVLNAAIQDIGMGRYQWQLFGVIGFGWAGDNLWPIVTSLIFTPVANEFTPTKPPLLTLSPERRTPPRRDILGVGMRHLRKKMGFQPHHRYHRHFRPGGRKLPELCFHLCLCGPLVRGCWRKSPSRQCHFSRIPSSFPPIPPNRAVHLLGPCTSNRDSCRMAAFGVPYMFANRWRLHSLRKLRMALVHDCDGRSVADHVHHPLFRIRFV